MLWSAFLKALARPRLRPARSKDLKVALGAVPMGEAASL